MARMHVPGFCLDSIGFGVLLGIADDPAELPARSCLAMLAVKAGAYDGSPAAAAGLLSRIAQAGHQVGLCGDKSLARYQFGKRRRSRAGQDGQQSQYDNHFDDGYTAAAAVPGYAFLHHGWAC